MKIMIQKFAKGGSQIGGQYASYAASYTPLDVEPQISRDTSSSSSKSSSNKDKNDLTLKDVVSVFDNVKGLTSDVNLVLNDFARVIQGQLLTSATGELSVSTLATKYLSNLAKFNALRNGWDEYNNVRTQLEKNNSLDEVAIDGNGNIVVLTGEGLDKMTPAEFIQAAGAVKALTNHELLDLRYKNPNFAFRDDIYSNISGVGMDAVISKINNLVKTIGSTKKEQLSDSMQKIAGGIEFIQDLNEEGEDASQALGSMMIIRQGRATEDQVEQAQAAVSAVLQALNPQEQALIAYHSTQNGGSGVLGFVTDLIGSRTSASVKQSDLISRIWTPSIGKKSSSKDSSSSSQELKDEHDNPLQDMINLQGGTVTPMYFVTSTGNEAMGTRGVTWSKLTERDPGTTSLSNMLNKTGIGGIVRTYGGITFGDIPVPAEFLKDIMYKEGGGTVAILPAKYDIMGNQMVDLSLLDEFKEITSSVTQYAQGTEEWWAEVSKQVKEKGLGQYLLGDGSIDKKQFGTFLMVEGFMTDSALKSINPAFKESHYMENEGSRDDILELMRTALSPDGGKTTYDTDTKNLLNPLDWFGAYDDVYHANVFIPLTNNNLQTVNAWGQTINESSAMRKQADYQADYNGKLDRDINAGSDLLNQ